MELSIPHTNIHPFSHKITLPTERPGIPSESSAKVFYMFVDGNVFVTVCQCIYALKALDMILDTSFLFLISMLFPLFYVQNRFSSCILRHLRVFLLRSLRKETSLSCIISVNRGYTGIGLKCT